ncbi:MAG: hypothetical protein Hyperionvirus13_45 [Hyperionvirus sp.]|uniref:Uncharacterized protein n=1 Tax=Hyperionvirus sp. TaxID=2487770 RepID=A0A3G5A9X9_9VIRU|nr:MAG: hypothetical protein Hyperionvirus13_45 [Hyperionvirus sp.]
MTTFAEIKHALPFATQIGFTSNTVYFTMPDHKQITISLEEFHKGFPNYDIINYKSYVSTADNKLKFEVPPTSALGKVLYTQTAKSI